MTLRTILLALSMLTASQAYAGSPLKIMQSYQGMHERRDRAALKRIMGVDPARTPWCAAMVSAVMRKAGRKLPPGSNMARSWLRFGKSVKLRNARPGDVVVLARHVGLFVQAKGGKVCLLSGNSGNSIRQHCYSAGRVKGVRR